MTALAAVLRTVARDLSACGARFALVGGLAVSVRSEPRFTRDIDLAVAVESDDQAEAVVRSLIARGYRVLAQVEQDGVGRLATVRLLPPDERNAGGVVVDLLFASSGIEPELVRAAEQVEVLPGLVLPVATTADLIALKLLAHDDRRSQDLADALKLLETAGPQDVATVRERLAWIEERGFHRGKDLQSVLARWLK